MTTLADPCEVDCADDIPSPREILMRREIAPPTENPVPRRHARTAIVGNSQALRSVVSQAEQVAATDAIVLILGETGTGKELLAQHMHRVSSRGAKSFTATNVAAIPATLLESEL